MKAATMVLDPKDGLLVEQTIRRLIKPRAQKDQPTPNHWIWQSKHTAVLTVGTR